MKSGVFTVKIGSVEVTNMVMIYDREHDLVLVQNRIKSWKGIAFPGGHLESGESIYESAVREVKEETGIDVSNLTVCGIVHWSNIDDGSQTFIHYYKTESFSGELIGKTEEGENFWVDPSKLSGMKLAPGFSDQLCLFFDDNIHELLVLYNNRNNDLILKWF